MRIKRSMAEGAQAWPKLAKSGKGWLRVPRSAQAWPMIRVPGSQGAQGAAAGQGWQRGILWAVLFHFTKVGGSRYSGGKIAKYWIFLP